MRLVRFELQTLADNTANDHWQQCLTPDSRLPTPDSRLFIGKTLNPLPFDCIRGRKASRGTVVSMCMLSSVLITAPATAGTSLDSSQTSHDRTLASLFIWIRVSSAEIFGSSIRSPRWFQRKRAIAFLAGSSLFLSQYRRLETAARGGKPGSKSPGRAQTIRRELVRSGATGQNPDSLRRSRPNSKNSLVNRFATPGTRMARLAHDHVIMRRRHSQICPCIVDDHVKPRIIQRTIVDMLEVARTFNRCGFQLNAFERLER